MKIKYNERESLERELARYKGMKETGIFVIPLMNPERTKVMKMISIDEIIKRIELTLKGKENDS